MTADNSSPHLSIPIPPTAVHPDASTAEAKPEITISWTNVSYSVKVGKDTTKALLQNVSGEVAPGEVVAILGASGAGKSTLLNVLAGRIGPGELSGDILINGRPRQPATWKQTIAYVEQDDLMLQNLSVNETLTYSALLRLPKSMSKKEKTERVRKVIGDLGLSKCEKTWIGDTEQRGISGGERKRVAIGTELVVEKKLLFLDEPTSGLDAFTAMNIIELCRDLAKKERRTILMTIHQPREYILSLFDKIILLSAGKTVYFGPLKGAIEQFAKVGFNCPPNTNPSDFFLDTMSIDYRSEELKQQSLDRCKKLQDAWVQPPNKIERSSDPAPVVTKRPWSNPPSKEIGILLNRGLVDLVRDKPTIFATIGQGIINAILLGLIFLQTDESYKGLSTRLGFFSLTTIQLTFGNVMPTIAVFTIQRNIIRRERAAGMYRASSAYISKCISNIPTVLIGTLLFGIPVYWMVGLRPEAGAFFTFLLILVLHALLSSFYGILISSGVPNIRVGQIVGPMTIVLFFLFGGAFANLDSIPVFLRWIKWISPIHYTYEALAFNEFAGKQYDCPPETRVCFATGEDIIEFAGLDDVGLWYSILINTCIMVVIIIGGYVIFRVKCKPPMKLA